MSSKLSERRKTQNREAQRRFRQKRQQKQEQADASQAKLTTTNTLQQDSAPRRTSSSPHKRSKSQPDPKTPDDIPVTIHPTFLDSLQSSPSDLGFSFRHGSVASDGESSQFQKYPDITFGDDPSFSNIGGNMHLPISQPLPMAGNTGRSLQNFQYDDIIQYRCNEAGVPGDIPYTVNGAPYQPTANHDISAEDAMSQFSINSAARPLSSQSNPTRSASATTTSIDPTTQGHRPVPMSRGQSMSESNSGWRPLLHVSAEHGHESIIHILLQQGVNINEQDDLGRTALHLAVRNKHEGVLQALLMSGAEKNIQDVSGYTPLHLAAENGFEVGFHTLLLHGANLAPCPDLMADE